MNNQAKFYLFLAVFGLFLMIYSFDMQTGWWLLIAILSLAIAFRYHMQLKSFAYTLAIIAGVSLSMYYPHLFTSIGTFKTTKLIVPLLQLIMVGMGAQLSLKDFEHVLKAPKAVAIGVACQFTIMPVIAFVLVRTFAFSPEIAAGILLVGSSPSGLASNVMAFIARANVALSVTLTAIATLLSPLITPFIMLNLANELIPIHFLELTESIMNMVILPVVAGLLFNEIAFGSKRTRQIWIQVLIYASLILLKNLLVDLTHFNLILDLALFLILPVMLGRIAKAKHYRSEHIEKGLAFISMLGIAVIIVVITSAGRENLLSIGSFLILACFIHNVSGYTLGYVAARLLGLDLKSAKTIAFEVGMQNSGLAAGLAVVMGKVATVGLAPAVFGPLMNITGSSLATLWRGNKEHPSSDQSNRSRFVG